MIAPFDFVQRGALQALEQLADLGCRAEPVACSLHEELWFGDAREVRIAALCDVDQGHLDAARARISAIHAVEPTTLVAYFANYWDLYWALPDAQQDLLLRLTPRPFDDNRGAWGISRAGAYAIRYWAQTTGYGLLVLTDRYPYSGPAERRVEDAAEPAPPVWPRPGLASPA